MGNWQPESVQLFQRFEADIICRSVAWFPNPLCWPVLSDRRQSQLICDSGQVSGWGHSIDLAEIFLFAVSQYRLGRTEALGLVFFSVLPLTCWEEPEDKGTSTKRYHEEGMFNPIGRC